MELLNGKSKSCPILQVDLIQPRRMKVTTEFSNIVSFNTLLLQALCLGVVDLHVSREPYHPY